MPAWQRKLTSDSPLGLGAGNNIAPKINRPESQRLFVMHQPRIHILN